MRPQKGIRDVARAHGKILAHLPFRDGHISVTKAYLCCVLAKQGNLPAAKQNFAEAEKYLVATGETRLLEQCQKATAA